MDNVFSSRRSTAVCISSTNPLENYSTSNTLIISRLFIPHVIMPATHAQETCTRKLQAKKIDASSSIAPKLLSSQSRCTVRVTCLTVSGLLSCVQETCTRKTGPTHVQVSCTRRLVPVSV